MGVHLTTHLPRLIRVHLVEFGVIEVDFSTSYLEDECISFIYLNASSPSWTTRRFDLHVDA